MNHLVELEAWIRSVVGGRRWIVTADAAAATTAEVEKLRSCGATDVLVVAGVPGIGGQPDCDVVFTGAVTGTSIMEGLRHFERSIARPSTELSSAIDAFDPDRRAWVTAGSFDSGTVRFGRRLYGARRPAWAALEDKIAIRDVFERAGVPTAPSVVVAVADAARAARDLETPLGSVWAADNREGWHGGAEGTRWVGPSDADRDRATRWAAEIAGLVRVMPFLEGVPCSIHGFRTRTGLAVFRPIEMNIFMTADHQFRYGGLASSWAPDSGIHDSMRVAANAVGETLHATVGYLGPFSLDGVATADGFFPTEVNPRLSAGLQMQARPIEGLDLAWLTRGVLEDEFSVDHRWIEESILREGQIQVDGKLVLALFEPVAPAEVRIRFVDGPVAVAAETDATATLSVGPGPAGPVVFMRFDDDSQPIGQRFAPYALAAARYASRLWGFSLEELVVAPDPSAAAVTPPGV